MLPFLRDESRAPAAILVGMLDTYVAVGARLQPVLGQHREKRGARLERELPFVHRVNSH